jgi:hypothetical protein
MLICSKIIYPNSIGEKIDKEFAVSFFEMLVSNSAYFLSTEEIYKGEYSGILRDIDNAIDFFARPDVEQYEKCYYLKKVREQL